MAGKSALSFSFAKKAEPKRVVEALKTKKEVVREVITSLEGGEVKLDGPAKAAQLLTIPCKNPLEEKRQAKPPEAKAPPPEAPEAPEAAAAAKKQLRQDEQPGGLLAKNISSLSAEDAEAAKELLKDAAAGRSGEEASAVAMVAPILMREGSRRVRDEAAPEASKDMFDKVPVEAFGEALLRGMGYDPEKHKTKPVYHDKIRDNLLGLGAKALLPSEKLPQRPKAGSAAAKAKADAQAKAAAAAQAKAAAAPPAVATATASAPPAAPSAPAPASEGERAAKRARAIDAWPSRGLVVRVVGSESRLADFFGAEAVVLEIDAAALTCRIKARANGQSHVLSDVPVQSLETRVSRDCKQVRVVRGSHRGTVAKLLRRDPQRGVASVRLGDEERELPLDDVCQFMA